MTRTESNRRYYIKNRDKIIKKVLLWRADNRLRYNASERIRQKEYRKDHPRKYPLNRRLDWIKERCNNPRRSNYKNYGAKGIRCLLSVSDLRFLWARDKADFMIRPTIHRLNPDENYILSNCQFVDWKDHCKIKKKKI